MRVLKNGSLLLDVIAGARPNFVKIAPILEAIEAAQAAGWPLAYRLIHTGQHTGEKMSDAFFRQLRIPKPHLHLEAGSGTPTAQTAAIMLGYEKALQICQPDLVLVVGDVTSTMACAITAKKVANIPVAHVEGGLRSHDLSMPEEINRIVTDAVTDYFFTTSETATKTLLHSGVLRNRIFFVGNTMIDTLLKHQPRFTAPPLWQTLGLKPQEYLMLTLHRPANVDASPNLEGLLKAVVKAARGLPLIFPVHPRTAVTLRQTGLEAPNLHVVEPLGYLEFNYLVQHAKAVLTDSGGVTEEATVLHVPCMTLRATTERPETCTLGTNRLLGKIPDAIAPAFEVLFAGKWPKGKIPAKWDGRAASRIIDALIAIFDLQRPALF